MSTVAAEDGKHGVADGGGSVLMGMPLAEFLETAAALMLTPAELMASLLTTG